MIARYALCSVLAAAAAMVTEAPVLTESPRLAGISLGMTEAEALAKIGATTQAAAVAQSWGDKLFSNDSGVSLQTCKGRVAHVSIQVPGGFHELAAILQRETDMRGVATLSATNGAQGADAVSKIFASWPIPDNGTYVVTYSAIGRGPAVIGRSIQRNEICRPSSAE